MSITLALLTAHVLADFPLQSDRMARAKFDDRDIRAGHVLVHWTLTYLLLLPFVGHLTAAGAAAVIAVLHFAIDSRRWAEPKEGFEIYPVAVDQALHIASLYLTVLLVF